MRSDAGYTLLELVVAIAVMTLTAVPLMLSMDFSVRAWIKVHEDVGIAERDFLVRTQLQSWLMQAYPIQPDRKTDEIQYPMTGTQNRLSFVAPVHPDPRLNTLYRVDLSLAGNVLVARIQPDFSSYDVSPQWEEVPLLQGVETLEFGYLDDQTAPGDPAWVGTWEEKPLLPGAVRMRLAFSGKHRQWPEVVVETAIEQWAHCAYSATNGTCQSEAIR